MPIKKLEGIDTEKGLAQYNGDETVYFNMLRTYMLSLRAMANAIETFNENEIEGYRVKVHGIRGASGHIFATQISESAAALENAAMEGDTAFIKQNHAPFINSAYALVQSIEEIFASIPQIAKPEKDKPDSALLEKLIDACNGFKMEDVENAMVEIEKFSYTNDGGLAAILRENVDMVNYREIVELLEKGE
ncbi:MAG: hypothetical protein FWB96_09095 [Defluviitaleaceae bacterium]|nr:hypothetical protein [Defluviitaleaceae bacterium]MCL2264277.1 hypothetical protein [Defluviitaleaceae bacterium]